MEDQVAAMLGGGQSVGGVVSDPVGTALQVIRHFRRWTTICGLFTVIVGVNDKRLWSLFLFFLISLFSYNFYS